MRTIDWRSILLMMTVALNVTACATSNNKIELKDEAFAGKPLAITVLHLIK